MKIPKIARAVGHIDDDLIASAVESNKETTHALWLKWGSLAACFAVLVIAASTILPSFGDRNHKKNDRYKNYMIQTETADMAWSWNYKTIYEKYTGLTLDNISYGNHGRAVSKKLIGEQLGTCSVVGYDNINKEQHTRDFEVYQLKYADKSQCIAVNMEGTYYVFTNEAYAPPATLGELFELVDLPKAIELNRFSQNGDGPNDKHFSLNKDDYVWNVLANCKDAPFVEDDWWTAKDREYLSFTVTSETLGVYKVALYITADGYLWTNAFDYGYLFHIGKDAAEKIIRYANENSKEAAYEPYQNAIVGKVVEITKKYILVDDSVLCKDPTDGITYKVLLNDLRISRYVNAKFVKVGDTVQIAYDGEIDKQPPHTITSGKTIMGIRIYFDNEEEKSTSTPHNNKTVTSTTSRPSYNPLPE